MGPRTTEEIRDCVKKTIDECLVAVMEDRPAFQLSSRHQTQLTGIIDELASLFMDIRLRNP